GAFSDPTTVTINVVPRAEPPTIVAADATGKIGAAIPLAIGAALTDGDGSETLSVLLSGVPSDVTLSHGTHQADGTWLLTPADVTALSLVAPTLRELVVTAAAISQETANGDTASTRVRFTVTVDPSTQTVNVNGGTYA